MVGLLTVSYNLGWIGDGSDDEATASFSVDPDSLDFQLGGTKEVTVENTGADPISLLEARIEGDDAFDVVEDACAGAELAPGRTCRVEVGLNRGLSVEGSSATLVITAAGGEQSQEVELESPGI